MHRTLAHRALTASLLLVATGFVTAVEASTVQVLDDFNFIDHREPSALGAGGLYLNVGADIAPAAGTSVTARQGSTVKPVPYLNAPASPNQFISNRFAYDPALTGAWTLTINNTAAANTPFQVSTLPICPTLCSGQNSASNPFLTPFITDVMTDGLSTTPRLTWSVPTYAPPAGTVAGVSLDIFALQANGSYSLISATTLTPTATSFAVPPNLLVDGRRYVVSVQTNLYNTADAGPSGRGSVVEESRSLFSFSPSSRAPSFPGPVSLPVVDSNGRFSFNLAVVRGSPVLLDPAVATGYDYQVGAGDPLFASVELPDLGSFDYQLYLWNGSQWVFDTDLASLTPFDFAGNGVDRFRIAGIPLGELLDPGDPTAFETRVTFASDGRFTGTMTALVSQAPEPATIALFAVGLLGSLSARRRRPAAASRSGR